MYHKDEGSENTVTNLSRNHFGSRTKVTIPDGEVQVESTSFSCAAWYNAYQKGLITKENDQEEGHIEVYYPEAPQTISDELIYSRIIFALFSDAAIDDTHIGVRVEKGLVTLSGAARNDRHKFRAENIVIRENGVIAVRNNLEILPEIRLAEM